jgi:hypothetical protein
MKVAVLSTEQIRIGCKLRCYFNLPFKLGTKEMSVSPNVPIVSIVSPRKTKGQVRIPI